MGKYPSSSILLLNNYGRKQDVVLNVALFATSTHYFCTAVKPASSGGFYGKVPCASSSSVS